MESKNRNLWIVVIVALVIACCCILALAAGAASWLANRYVDLDGRPLNLDAPHSQREEQRFEIGDTPNLEVTNFAGTVTVRAGEGSLVHVVATKRASRQSRLDHIEVEMRAGDGELVIQTKKLFSNSNASVELEITAPAGSRVRVNTGAGEVTVRDMVGPLEIHSGAGEVDVSGAQNTIRVDLGAGEIRYEGTPNGDCRFQTGIGEIVLRLPERPDVRIDVGTGLGGVDIDFEVEGRVSGRRAEGTIGDGRQGSIFAHTGVGAVSVRRR